MGTPHAGTTRTSTVPVRFTEEGVARIDEMRGSWTRSEYVRRAVAQAVKQNKRGPDEPAHEEW
jgi:hypothetical protein